MGSGIVALALRAAIPIGPFELHAPLGRGGMGEVWRGVHVAQEVPVALKVLRGERALSAEYVAAFRREAERLAALDHPAIVTILDFGVLPVDAGARSEGRLIGGSPYLAMELAEGGALAAHAPLAWPEVVRVMRVLLDALAHAHARGVIHRDLKPANVLVSGCTDGTRAEVLLTDFGIAHALGSEAAGDLQHDGELLGTPGFMAPEQVRGEWRDLGPWTDLYALGCLAWALLAGGPPFAGETPVQVLFVQLTRDLPRLPEHVAVPEGAQAWIDRLACVDARARFRRAADAAAALERVVASGAGPLTETITPLLAPTLDRAFAVTATPTAATLEAPRALAAQARAAAATPGAERSPSERETGETLASGEVVRVSSAERAPSDAPRARMPDVVRVAFPSSWRIGSASPPRMQLVGAGLSLYGAREVPLAGREHERDRLWAALREVREERAPRLVVLRGPSGVGKSRLLRWTLHRAHELGLAITMLARHGPERGPRDGLVPALARHLGCVQLAPDRLRARIALVLAVQGEDDPMEAEALFALLAPFACPEGAPRGTDREAAAHTLRRALEREARERPVVLGLDDLQWGDETARLLAVLRASALPLLVVATVQEEAPRVTPDTRARLTELVGARGATLLPVGPLGAEDHLRLVQDLLRLEPALARELARRTDGNPLFAEQLVGDWVRRGLLEIREPGFALREGVTIELPDDLHAVWIARVDRMLRDRPEAERAALELAALLGHRVEEREWERACELAALPSPRALSAVLARARLVDRDADGTIAFVHGMLRESVLRAAREAGRRDAQVATIEALLRELMAAGVVDASERLGRLLADAGRSADAAPLLVQAAESRRRRCDYGTALALTEEAEACLDRAGAAPDDARRGAGWIVRSWSLRMVGEYAASRDLAERVLAHDGQGAWEEHVPGALLRRADVDVRLGRIDRARVDLDLASEELTRRADVVGIASTAWLRAWIDVFQGDLESPLTALAGLRTLAESPAMPPPGALHVYWTVGFVHLAREEPDAAEASYRLAEESARAQKNRLGLAHARFGASAVALLRGRVEDAIETARESIALYRDVGSGESHFAELALGLAWLRAGRPDEAERVLAEAAVPLARSGRVGFLLRLDVARIGVDAALGRWDAMLARARDASAPLRLYRHRETLLARELMIAAATAEAAGRDDATRVALSLALHHFDKPHTLAEHAALAARRAADG